MYSWYMGERGCVIMGGGCLCVDRSNSPAQCVSTAGRALEETHTLTKCLPIEPDDKIIIEEREEETEGRERERGGERGGREREEGGELACTCVLGSISRSIDTALT